MLILFRTGIFIIGEEVIGERTMRLKRNKNHNPEFELKYQNEVMMNFIFWKWKYFLALSAEKSRKNVQPNGNEHP